jgi:hypothetical protein
MKSFPFILITFLLITNSISAQIKHDTTLYHYAIKGYLNFTDNTKTTIITDDTLFIQKNTEKNKTILPTIGWSRFRKNGRFNEFGITRLSLDYQYKKSENKLLFQRDSFGNIIPGIVDIPSREVKIWTNNLGLRFEWNFPIFRKENNDFVAFLGFSTDPSVFYQKILPGTMASFPTRVFELSNTITLIPRVTYAFTNRFFMDINMPFSLVTFSGNYTHEDNPVLPSYARESINFRTRLPSNIWAIRLGIGYKI